MRQMMKFAGVFMATATVTVESSDPESITSVGQELVRIVVKSLSRHGLI